MILMMFVVIPPFAFLILLICVFFSPYFSQVCQEPISLVNFSKNQIFVSSILYFCVYFINFNPYFYDFSPSASFVLCLFSFF
jgi:hypothetical protein